MKNITILGNLGKAPEKRTTQSGKDLVSFSVATSDGWGDNKRTLWFDVTIWGRRGDALLNMSKGEKICVTGDLSTREHEGKTYLTINANDFSFGGGKKDDGGYQQPQQQPAPTDIDDEIPF